MTSVGYQYQTDDGEIHEVDFKTAMDDGDFCKLPDGRTARRINRPSMKKKTKGNANALQHPAPSNSMGFTDNQLAQKRAEAEANPNEHRGIEFVQDPTQPRFYQVHCSSEGAKKRYMKFRQMNDYNSLNGAGCMLSPELCERAQAIIKREYGEANTEKGEC